MFHGKNIWDGLASCCLLPRLRKNVIAQVRNAAIRSWRFYWGWAGLFSGGAAISWMANPLLLASWLLLGKKLKAAMFLSIFATLLSLSFLLFDGIVDNEGGQPHKIISYKAGYWLWAGSCICMMVGTYALMLRHNTRRRAERLHQKSH